MDYEVRGCILIVDGNAIDLNSVVHITDIFKGGVAPIYTFSINYGLHGSEEINVYVIDEERRKHIGELHEIIINEWVKYKED